MHKQSKLSWCFSWLCTSWSAEGLQYDKQYCENYKKFILEIIKKYGEVLGLQVSQQCHTTHKSGVLSSFAFSLFFPLSMLWPSAEQHRRQDVDLRGDRQHHVVVKTV